MRILHVTTEYPPIIYGGLGTAVGGLVSASSAAGLNVAVLLVGAGSLPAYGLPAAGAAAATSVRSVDRAGVLLHGVAHLNDIDDSVRFAKWWKPDIIHLHVFWLSHVAFAIRAETGAPLVYTVHSLDRAEYELGEAPSECLAQWDVQYQLISAADRIVALTEDERALIGEYCPAARGRVAVVGNGIADSARARRAAAQRSRREPVTVLYTGRFVPRKGIRELLDAVPQVLAHAPDTRFVMAGGFRHAGGEDMARYWLPQSCMPHRDRIHFTGWLTPHQLNAWYESADVLAVPSWYEPFGMVILEGMLYGLPILAAAVGGPKEILEHGRTGLLCAPRDTASLRDALLQVIHDPALRWHLGHNAARDVRRRWLYRNVVGRMRAVYSGLESGPLDKAR